jgi:hypothetical protein
LGGHAGDGIDRLGRAEGVTFFSRRRLRRLHRHLFFLVFFLSLFFVALSGVSCLLVDTAFRQLGQLCVGGLFLSQRLLQQSRARSSSRSDGLGLALRAR